MNIYQYNLFEQPTVSFPPPSRAKEKEVSSATKALTIGGQTICFTFSKRLKRGWRVEKQSVSRRLVTLPIWFQTAPESIFYALASWAALPFRLRKNSENYRLRKTLEKQIWSYVDQTIPRKIRMPISHRLQTKGVLYDLVEVFDSLNRTYFQSKIVSRIRWGSPNSTTSYQTRRIIEGTEQNLITIAGAYDHPKTPRFAIEAICYHEMLHIAIPPKEGKQRRHVHTAEFKRAEQAFIHYKQWIEWEKKFLRRYARQKAAIRM